MTNGYVPLEWAIEDHDVHVHIGADDWTVSDDGLLIHPDGKQYRIRKWLIRKLMPPKTLVIGSQWAPFTFSIKYEEPDD